LAFENPAVHELFSDLRLNFGLPPHPVDSFLHDNAGFCAPSTLKLSPLPGMDLFQVPDDLSLLPPLNQSIQSSSSLMSSSSVPCVDLNFDPPLPQLDIFDASMPTFTDEDFTLPVPSFVVSPSCLLTTVLPSIPQKKKRKLPNLQEEHHFEPLPPKRLRVTINSNSYPSLMTLASKI
jgi:hypothetical protein